jgi:hypothetical protein
MAKSAAREVSHYGIYRVDSVKKAQHGWTVTVGRDRSRQQKFFSDVIHGGQQRSLRAAQKFRDNLATTPLMSKQDYVSIVRRNNNSGVSGVCRIVVTRRNGEKGTCWLATWPKADGRVGRAKFSVQKYGYAQAFELAVRARLEAISRLEGPHVTATSQRDWLESRQSQQQHD